MFRFVLIFSSLLSLVILSGCMQTFKVECGTYEGNNVNTTWRTLNEQAKVVRSGHREKSQTTSIPYVTQYWNGYQYVSQTKYKYNTVKQYIPINVDYEKKVLQQYLNNYENAYSAAKVTQEACMKQGKGTFTLRHDIISSNINSVKMLLN